jgi:Mor family transcriptional regulator
MQIDAIKIEDLPEDFRDIAENIGLDAAVKLFELRGGETIYLCKLETVRRNARNRSIKREFNGRNYRELAKKHRLTVSMIRQIVNGRIE